MIQYVIGLVLCILVAFVYSSTRKDAPRQIFRDGLVVLAWMLAALAALGAFGYLASRFL